MSILLNGFKMNTQLTLILIDIEKSIQLFKELLLEDNSTINNIMLNMIKLEVSNKVVFSGEFGVDMIDNIEYLRSKIINFNMQDILDFNVNNYIDYVIVNLKDFNKLKNQIISKEYTDFTIFTSNSLIDYNYKIEIKLPFDEYKTTNTCLIDWLNLEVQQTGE